MRTLITLAIGLALTLSLAACQPKPAVTAVTSDDMSMGNPNAKVTVIEYASVSCPVCAGWNNENFAAFKAKYIDTGKINYVLREAFTGDPPQLAAAGFLMARCAGKDKYFPLVDVMYHQQHDIETSGDYNGGLLKIAKSVGMTEAQFNACITDQKALTAFNDRWDRYTKDDHINGTPTFVINGKMMDPNRPPTPAEMDAAIAQAQAEAGKPAS